MTETQTPAPCNLSPIKESLPPLALSVRQPWAWAIMFAGKHLENRSRYALKHMLGRMRRGRICIHAAKGMTREEYEAARDTIARATAVHRVAVECPSPAELVRGAIIGTVEVTGTLSPETSTSPWWAGGSALTITDPQPLSEPLPLAGALGYFDWLDSIARDKRTGRTIEAPLPWMRAWPGRAHPNGRDVIAPPAQPASLFE